jgi:dTDP-4-amino-4,6-dideoxygalactose transaminase
VTVPLVDLKAQFQPLRSEVMRAIEEVLSSGQLFLGPNTRAFEDEYAAYCGTQFCIGVGNGTDALHLALRAAGIGPGDEVITVSHTFIATIEAIELVGARPVLVDIDPRTFNIAPEGIERAITPRTKAIIPVHLYGRLADMDAILEIAGRRKLIVIEDASQSQGAIDAHGRRAGSIGHLGCFSFYYAKNLGAYGEAGAITTSDPELDRRIRLLRSHGESQRYEHEIMGFNCRPDEIQSAVLRIKLQHLDEWNHRRRQHAMRYHELLSDLAIELPELRFDGSNVYHQYVIRSSERDTLRSRLSDKGIGTGIHYPVPVHLQPAAVALGYAQGDFPHTEAAAKEVLSLPMYPELTQPQLTAVAEAIAQALQVPQTV